ncbi:uncharacterized protein BCR38DRAFT_491010 [Pseudomassariella vexata]|uniref:Uncharacterized protein n=1 Tax=Pseudomassariella vexata TaxID=1141098 RepID=A0A1Y2D8T0_9PEZI|nr:uncharacterized protein BCR38DRAFT_491010 [Pseudomassariella vexata]ORY55672.1 hypothetical protein BCR38DRAFT_491010 [Pseudomassariella vexata]
MADIVKQKSGADSRVPVLVQDPEYCVWTTEILKKKEMTILEVQKMEAYLYIDDRTIVYSEGPGIPPIKEVCAELSRALNTWPAILICDPIIPDWDRENRKLYGDVNTPSVLAMREQHYDELPLYDDKNTQNFEELKVYVRKGLQLPDK